MVSLARQSAKLQIFGCGLAAGWLFIHSRYWLDKACRRRNGSRRDHRRQDPSCIYSASSPFAALVLTQWYDLPPSRVTIKTESRVHGAKHISRHQLSHLRDSFAACPPMKGDICRRMNVPHPRTSPSRMRCRKHYHHHHHTLRYRRRCHPRHHTRSRDRQLVPRKRTYQSYNQSTRSVESLPGRGSVSSGAAKTDPIELQVNRLLVPGRESSKS